MTKAEYRDKTTTRELPHTKCQSFKGSHYSDVLLKMSKWVREQEEIEITILAITIEWSDKETVDGDIFWEAFGVY
jgi:hypothetical protein